MARPGRPRENSGGTAARAASVDLGDSGGQRQGGFWFVTYQGALNAELFIALLKNMMRNRAQPVHLVIDGLTAHKKANVREYVASTQGKLTVHVLPGYAPEFEPGRIGMEPRQAHWRGAQSVVRGRKAEFAY
jgi:hypothetical protein